jgi:acyl carrier protein
MEMLKQKVQDLVEKMAVAKGLNSDSAIQEILQDSLDQMRFLVALEEQLGTYFDDTVLEPFKLENMSTLIESVQSMVEKQKVM